MPNNIMLPEQLHTEPFRSPRHTGHRRPLRHALESAVATAFGVPLTGLRATTRGGARTAFARQAAIYVAHVAFGLSYRDAGQMFSRDRTTAAHACRVVEERRDDPRVDDKVQSLERACRALCGGQAGPGAPQ